MSESLKFLIGSGAVFTALAVLACALAATAEKSLRPDAKSGFTAWLTNTAAGKSLRDWCPAFTALYDTAFDIKSSDTGFGAPNIKRTVIFAAVSLAVIFVAFGQVQAVADLVDHVWHDNQLAEKFPRYARSMMIDLTAMILVAFAINVGAIYVSVLKTRLILEKLLERPGALKRAGFVLLDIVASLAMFAIVFQVGTVLQEAGSSFLTRRMVRWWYDLRSYDVPSDITFVPKLTEIYFRFLMPVSLALVLPILWAVLFAVGGVITKALLRIEVLRRHAIMGLALEQRPLWVAGWYLIALLVVAFWIPVSLCAALQ